MRFRKNILEISGSDITDAKRTPQTFGVSTIVQLLSMPGPRPIQEKNDSSMRLWRLWGFSSGTGRGRAPRHGAYHKRAALALGLPGKTANFHRRQGNLLLLVLVAEWLACWTQARKGMGSNRSRDAAG